MVERTSARGPAHRLPDFADTESPLAGLHRGMNSLLAEFARNHGFTVGDPTDGQASTWPRVNVSESGEAFRLSADLPGLDAKCVRVSLENDSTVVLEGEHLDEREEHGRNWIRHERGSGSFRRAIELPVTVDASKVTAAFAKGVLVIEAPKSREAVAKRRSVEIKSS